MKCTESGSKVTKVGESSTIISEERSKSSDDIEFELSSIKPSAIPVNISDDDLETVSIPSILLLNDEMEGKISGNIDVPDNTTSNSKNDQSPVAVL